MSPEGGERQPLLARPPRPRSKKKDFQEPPVANIICRFPVVAVDLATAFVGGVSCTLFLVIWRTLYTWLPLVVCVLPLFLVEAFVAVELARPLRALARRPPASAPRGKRPPLRRSGRRRAKGDDVVLPCGARREPPRPMVDVPITLIACAVTSFMLLLACWLAVLLSLCLTLARWSGADISVQAIAAPPIALLALAALFGGLQKGRGTAALAAAAIMVLLCAFLTAAKANIYLSTDVASGAMGELPWVVVLLPAVVVGAALEWSAIRSLHRHFIAETIVLSTPQIRSLKAAAIGMAAASAAAALALFCRPRPQAPVVVLLAVAAAALLVAFRTALRQRAIAFCEDPIGVVPLPLRQSNAGWVWDPQSASFERSLLWGNVRLSKRDRHTSSACFPCGETFGSGASAQTAGSVAAAASWPPPVRQQPWWRRGREPLQQQQQDQQHEQQHEQQQQQQQRARGAATGRESDGGGSSGSSTTGFSSSSADDFTYHELPGKDEGAEVEVVDMI